MTDQENGTARKRRYGKVVSARMDKTIVVETERITLHPLYKKYLRRNNRLKVHDENEDANNGDLVEIEETRPLSKSKRWRLLEIVKESDLPEESGLTDELESTTDTA